jgi:Spy/CpxP family protein refolding chaperone
VNHRFRTFLTNQISLTLLCAVVAVAFAGCAGNSNAASGSGDTTASSAQGGAGGRHMMAQALASLGLSDDQKTKIREIMKSAREKAANADPVTRRANYQAAMAKVKDVLTPDQRAKLAAKLAELRGGAQSQPTASSN